jgi:ketosteroid isomerase-like protein
MINLYSQSSSRQSKIKNQKLLISFFSQCEEKLLAMPAKISRVITGAIIAGCLASPILLAVPGQTEDNINLDNNIQTILQNINTAANRQDLEGVLQYYSPDFQNNDGFDRETLKSSLTEFWRRYQNVRYETEVKSVETVGDVVIVETLTQITGTEKFSDRNLNLKSTLVSKQSYRNDQIIAQEVISESTEITSGENPPTVEINVPTTIKVGEEFTFDAIVQEPLGNEVILGGAVQQVVQPSDYFQPADFSIDILNTGGVFKVGKLDTFSDSIWLSAILMRGGGITISTHRVRVTE